MYLIIFLITFIVGAILECVNYIYYLESTLPGCNLSVTCMSCKHCSVGESMLNVHVQYCSQVTWQILMSVGTRLHPGLSLFNGIFCSSICLRFMGWGSIV